MHTGGGEGTILERVRRAPLACMARLRRRPTGARKAGGQATQGGGAMQHAGLACSALCCSVGCQQLCRTGDACRELWPRNCRRVCLTCDEHDTALHNTWVQPIRLINLARAGADGPEPRRQVHLHCVFAPAPLSFFRLTGDSTRCSLPFQVCLSSVSPSRLGRYVD